MDRSLPKHPSPFKDSSGSMLLIALVLIMVVGIAGFFIWRAMKGGSLSASKLGKLNPASSLTQSTTQDPSADLQALDQDTSALENDLNGVDSALNDKPGDLSE